MPVNIEALELMADAAERRPDERFDMSRWYRRAPCGTVCCLFGSFMEAHGERYGLRFAVDTYGWTSFFLDGVDRHPLFIAEDLFGIKASDAVRLLAPYDAQTVTKAEAIRRLREFVAVAKSKSAKPINDPPTFSPGRNRIT